MKACFTSDVAVLSANSTMRGWLKKRSPAFHAQMQKRYFVLEDAMLTYYSNEACAESKGAIPLTALVAAKGSGTTIEVDVGYRTYKLVADSASSAAEWRAAIERNATHRWHKLHLDIDHAQLGRVECVLLTLDRPFVDHLAIRINHSLPCREDAPLVATADVALEPLDLNQAPPSRRRSSGCHSCRDA